MDYHWNDIRTEFSDAQNSTLPEKDFQSRINSIFKYYLRWGNNIVSEESIHIGSAQSIRPDFVLYENGVAQVVIEAKRPVHSQTERNREQLYSYMRQKKVDFGLYIGECIQLYYDNPNDKDFPNLILTIKYDEMSANGTDFVKLFAFDSFDEVNLRMFCEQKLTETLAELKLLSDRKELISNASDNYIKKLIKFDYLSQGYTSDWVDKLLDGLQISISENITTLPITDNETIVTQVTPKSHQKKGSALDYTHYTIDGQGDFGKGELAWECFNLFQAQNPMIYQELLNVFGNKVLSLSEIAEWKKTTTDKSKDRRWFERKPFVSSDGIEYALTTQIGKGNIDFFINLAKKLGHSITPK